MYLPEYATTPEFRAHVAELLPNLGSNLAYWRMVGYLMFAPGVKGRIPVPASLIAKVEGKQRNGKYCAWIFLEAFQADIVRLELTDWQIGRSRAVLHVHWPAEIETLMHRERRVANVPRVLFSTGVKWQRGHSAQERVKAQSDALETMANMGHVPAYDLLNLLNHAVPNRFNAIKKHLPAAHALVDNLVLAEDENKRQHHILEGIELQSQPFYSPAARSVRIFGTNTSLTSCSAMSGK